MQQQKYQQNMLFFSLLLCFLSCLRLASLIGKASEEKNRLLLDIVQKCPPQTRFGNPWGNFCLSRLSKKHTTKNYLKTI